MNDEHPLRSVVSISPPILFTSVYILEGNLVEKQTYDLCVEAFVYKLQERVCPGFVTILLAEQTVHDVGHDKVDELRLLHRLHRLRGNR